MRAAEVAGAMVRTSKAGTASAASVARVFARGPRSHGASPRESVSSESRAPDASPEFPPQRITFVLWDEETDGVAIKVDGAVVWEESTFDRISQFFLHSPELLGVPVVLAVERS